MANVPKQGSPVHKAKEFRNPQKPYKIAAAPVRRAWDRQLNE